MKPVSIGSSVPGLVRKTTQNLVGPKRLCARALCLPAQEEALREGPFSIHPLGQAIKATMLRQARGVLALELVGALGPNGFALLEADAHVQSANRDRVRAPHDEVHFNTALRGGPSSLMRE